MDSDLFLVVGLVLGGFAIPSIIGAFSESRPPRVAAILLMIASGLIVLAVMNKPSGYTLNEVPDVFVKVIARVFR